jgi:hypothetical protein
VNHKGGAPRTYVGAGESTQQHMDKSSDAAAATPLPPNPLPPTPYPPPRK